MTIDYEKLSHLIEKMMTYYHIPGMALGVIEKGRVHMESFGVRDRAGHPFLTDTISGIGSCSKSMTALAVMKLSEKGSLIWTHPLLPTFPALPSGTGRRRLW